MGKQNINSTDNTLKYRLVATGKQAENGIKWFLAAVDQGKADYETLLNLNEQLKARLSTFESVLEEFQAQIEKEQLER